MDNTRRGHLTAAAAPWYRRPRASFSPNYLRIAMTQKILLPSDAIETPYLARLDALANTVFRHPAMNNAFYGEWRTRRFSLQEFHIFSTNYFRRVYATPTRISIALTTIQDWISRIELLHNLTDELGEGTAANVHVLVLFRWLDALNSALGCAEPYRNVLDRSTPLPATQRFIDETNAMCGKSPQHAAGALLAQEWHGYTQIAYLLDGFQNYRHLFGVHDFHDACEYFYVHLGRAEKEHRTQSSVIAARNCQTDQDFAIVEAAFNGYLDLLYSFWESISAEYSERNIPLAIR